MSEPMTIKEIAERLGIPRCRIDYILAVNKVPVVGSKTESKSVARSRKSMAFDFDEAKAAVLRHDAKQAKRKAKAAEIKELRGYGYARFAASLRLLGRIEEASKAAGVPMSEYIKAAVVARLNQEVGNA